MPRYFFDTRNDDETIVDDLGVELPDVLEAAQTATRSLAELALEVLPGSSERCLGVDVRNEHHEPVLSTELTFRAVVVNAAA